MIRIAAAVVLAGLMTAAPARAEPVTVEGLTFSDELGGFTLISVSGRGRLDDPFVVVEEVTGRGEVVLVIRGLDGWFGNRVGSQHLVGFAMTKVTINRTDAAWDQYELELREVLDAHSPYGDGLSFGQAAPVGRPFRSSAFSRNFEVDEPYDSVSFRDGVVEVGKAASFRVIVTDMSPVPEFYLVQQPLTPVARQDAEDQLAAVRRSGSTVCRVSFPVRPRVDPSNGRGGPMWPPGSDACHQGAHTGAPLRTWIAGSGPAMTGRGR